MFGCVVLDDKPEICGCLSHFRRETMRITPVSGQSAPNSPQLISPSYLVSLITPLCTAAPLPSCCLLGCGAVVLYCCGLPITLVNIGYVGETLASSWPSNRRCLLSTVCATTVVLEVVLYVVQTCNLVQPVRVRVELYDSAGEPRQAV